MVRHGQQQEAGDPDAEHPGDQIELIARPSVRPVARAHAAGQADHAAERHQHTGSGLAQPGGHRGTHAVRPERTGRGGTQPIARRAATASSSASGPGPRLLAARRRPPERGTVGGDIRRAAPRGAGRRPSASRWSERSEAPTTRRSASQAGSSCVSPRTQPLTAGNESARSPKHAGCRADQRGPDPGEPREGGASRWRRAATAPSRGRPRRRRHPDPQAGAGPIALGRTPRKRADRERRRREVGGEHQAQRVHGQTDVVTELDGEGPGEEDGEARRPRRPPSPPTPAGTTRNWWLLHPARRLTRSCHRVSGPPSMRRAHRRPAAEVEQLGRRALR